MLGFAFFQYGAAADVYSLSILFIELFSGQNPFLGDAFQAKINDRKTPVPKDFPSKLKELVVRGCSKAPKERPQIEDFQSALNKMLSGAETGS
jgi:serine/threonine protein kinase